MDIPTDISIRGMLVQPAKKGAGKCYFRVGGATKSGEIVGIAVASGQWQVRTDKGTCIAQGPVAEIHRLEY